jgi:hypothetical protein
VIACWILEQIKNNDDNMRLNARENRIAPLAPVAPLAYVTDRSVGIPTERRWNDGRKN